MRRNKTFGLYSSHTIKRCFCEISEIVVEAANDRKLHKYGNGKIVGKEPFIQFDKKNHKKHSSLRYFKYKKEALRKRDLKAQAKEIEIEFLTWSF